jgi:hypothetical protein
MSNYSTDNVSRRVKNTDIEFLSHEEIYTYYVGKSVWTLYIMAAIVLVCLGFLYPR